MIRYQLKCDSGHQFDSWFRNAASFDEQAGAGLIDCPVCGSVAIEKALMAPNISARSNRREDESGPQPAPGSTHGSGSDEQLVPVASTSAGRTATDAGPLAPVHREVIEVMRKVRREVERNAEYVGPRFAEEARKIHHEESEPRGIYGEATPEEVSELTEEGIDFMPLPRLPEDNN